jgi:hypothetical protein
VLSRNSLQIVVLNDKKKEEKKEKIIKGELVKGETIKGKEKEYTVTPARSIALINLIVY